jgi:hypothetical protein
MPNLTGSFTGKSVALTSLALDDIPEHEFQLTQFSGPQIVTDDNWKDVKVTYWGTTDLIQGFGPLRGYFVNEHPNGDRDCGTYDGHISIANNEVNLEGTWRYTHGSGKFASISGNGRFRGRMTSLTEVEMSWQGNYQIAAGTRAA